MTLKPVQICEDCFTKEERRKFHEARMQYLASEWLLPPDLREAVVKKESRR